VIAAGAKDLQLARADAKFKRAMAVVSQVSTQAEAAGVTGNSWRGEMLANLMRGAEENFDVVRLAPSFGAAMSASMQVARAETSRIDASGAKALNSGTYDLVYVPITPCRVVDSRAAGAPIPANTVMSYFYSTGNTGSGACSVTGQIPSYASNSVAAFAANITLDETGLTGFAVGSFLKVYPEGGSTTTSFMNFGPNQVIANAGIVTVNPGNAQFSVVANAPAQVIVDTYGVFIEPEATALDCITTAVTSVVIGATQHNFATAPACATGYTGVALYCRMAFQADTLAASSGRSCSGTSTNPASTIEASQRCCRIPGR